MRFIKFRSLTSEDNHRLEFVRVTENGRIIPKNYEALDFQMLDDNIRNVGTCVSPAKILCYGAKDSSGCMDIKGPVDIFIDGESTPRHSNISPQELLALTIEDLGGFSVEECESTQFDLLSRASGGGDSHYSSLFIVVGIKYRDSEAIQFFSNFNANRLPYSNEHDLAIAINAWLETDVSEGFKVAVTKKDSAPFNELMEYVRYPRLCQEWFYTNFKYSGGFAADINFTRMPEDVEYVVLPSFSQPYGNVLSDEISYINNTLRHKNIYFYADGRKVYDEVTDLYVGKNLYNFETLPTKDLSSLIVDGNTSAVLNISDIPLSYCEVFASEGRIFKITVPEQVRWLKIEYLMAEYEDMWKVVPICYHSDRMEYISHATTPLLTDHEYGVPALNYWGDYTDGKMFFEVTPNGRGNIWLSVLTDVTDVTFTWLV